MPVEHQVWIRFKPDVPPERIDRHLAGLRGLKEKIPGILDLKVGANFTQRSDGVTHGLSVTLVDADALAAYGPHPEHRAVAGPLSEDADLRAVDFVY